MVSIFKRLWSKKRRMFFWCLIILAGYGIFLTSCGEIYEWFTWHTGRGEFFFHNVRKIDKDLMKRFCSLLEIEKFPESAKEIYLYYWGAVSDKGVYCSMTLSAEEIPKFAEYFIGVPLSAFREGIDYKNVMVSSDIYWISRGERRKGLVKNWNLKNIKNAKYFEVDREEEFKKLRMEIFGDSEEDAKSYYNAYLGRFIAIDMDTNRVYLYVR